jgi:hypothetical protein
LKFAFLAATQKPLLKVTFSVATVLVAFSGDQVSFNSTVGGGVALLKAGWGLEGVGF